MTSLPFDAPLTLLSRVHRVLHLGHLGDQVGRVEQPLIGVTAGDHDVLMTGPVPQRGHHLVDVHPTPLHRVGELVQDVQVMGLGRDPALDLPPALQRVGRVVLFGAGLARPAPPLAHLVPLDGAALACCLVHLVERPERRLLADLPLGALDELEHADVPALVPAAQRHPEGGGRLTLHLAGVHHHQRPGPTLPRGQAVLRYDTWLPLRHQAALRSVTARTKVPAATSPRSRYSARRSPASSPARPSRTPRRGSQSTTTAAIPCCATQPAACLALARALSPDVARPSVTSTSSGLLRGSRMAASRSTSAASSRPSASGVRPPVGKVSSRRTAVSTLPVGGSARVAAAPANVTRPTVSRRW